MVLDNSKLVATFAPEKADGDTFIYTEMLNRGQRKGNNGHRLVKTFYHRSRDEFWEQWPTLRELCDLARVRACTRVAPRSFKKVAAQFLRLVTETYITENYAGMKSLYNRACGIVSPNTKLWIFDIDLINAETRDLEDQLKATGVWVATLPSKKGLHYITKPHQVFGVPEGVSIHKDNPTNLYIPEGAD